MTTQHPRHLASGLAVVLLIAGAAYAAGPEPIARQHVSSSAIEWEPLVDNAGMHLRVILPDGTAFERDFAAGTHPAFDLARDGRNLDGAYRFEITLAVEPTPGERRMRDASPEHRQAAIEQLRAANRLPSETALSGTFRVQDGQLYAGEGTEQPPHRAAAAGASPAGSLRPIAAPDQVIADDLIVQGSACIGLDCVNNESFGFDTIRLKENNTRIKFDDTSTSAGFPNHDWQLTANDSASGGSNKFSIEDITAATVPFTVTGSAPTNSLFVDSAGRVGLRTSTPVLDLHIATNNTPAMRLEQNSSGGFTAQTWDIAGNEANFFVRDVTGGSRLPFRIRPGAPTSSIDISASGDVGVGTASPTAALHVSRSTGALATMLKMSNNLGIQVLFDRTDAGANDWQMSNFNQTFQVSVPGSATPQFSLNANGNLTIGGTQYLTGSSRDLKENFVPVNGEDILQRLVAMPLTEWNAKADPTQKHIGPVAEDWWATFRLGPDDKHVSTTDIGGVALAAIKGLYQVVAEKEASIVQLQQTVDGLRQQNAELAARLAAIEKALARHPE